MPQFDIALVAYTPDGARLGPLPAPLAITSATNPLNDLPVLAFDYLKDAPGAQHLANPIEVAVEVYNPATDTWFEPKNSRYLLLDWDKNQMEVTGKASYNCPGYGMLLDKIKTRPPSAADRSQEITTAKALAAAAKAAYAAATAALKAACGVPTNSGTIFADYEPTVTNNAVWVDSDETPIKVYKGSKPKGQTGAWVEVSTTAARTAATTANTKKLEYDDANAGITRAQNDKTFDREFPAANAGKIMHTLMTEAQARGDRIPGMTWDFTATTDSAGQAWAMHFEEPLVIRAGQSALDVLTDLTSQGLCDWVMEGRVLHLYNADTALLRDKTVHQLLPSSDIKDAPDRGTYNSLTHNVLFLGEEGLTFEMTNNVPMTPWGKWEESVSQGGVTRRSTGQLLGQAALDAGAGPRTESTRDLIFNDTRPLPYIHYVVGDTISTFGADGTAETMRVRQITLSRDAKGVPGGNLVLGDRFLEREVRQSRLIDGVTGGTVPKGNGSLPGTPVIPTERRPEAPHDLIAVANNYSDPNGKQIGRLLIDWVWDGTDTNGTPIEGNGFQVQIRPDHINEPWASARTVPESTMTLDDVRIRTEAGAIEIYDLRVRAVAYNGRTSDWSEVFTVMMAADVTPPPVPSALQGIPDHGAITAFWDGDGAGGEKMPLDFKATEGEIASAPTGPWTLFASYPYKGNMQVPQQLAYGTYWLRARSVDTSGNYSAYSELSTVTTTPLVDLPDVHDLIADYNQKFAEAMEGVGLAMSSANGKNRVIPSTSLPTITGGEQDGDVWWRYSNSTMNVLIGTWVFTAGAWKPYKGGYQLFDAIDAATITVGKLKGAMIEAKSLNIEHINVGDFSNLVTIDPEVPVNVTIPAAFATVAAGGFTYKADGGSDYLMFKDQNGPVPFKSGDWIRVAFDAMATSDVVIPTTVWFYPNKTGTTGAISASGTPITITPAVKNYSFDIQVPSLATIGGGKSWTIGLAGPGARQIGVRNVTAYRKVDATTIAPDSIRTPMLGADIIEGKHIKGNTVEADNMKAGFADFTVITGSTIQTIAAANRGLKLIAGTNRFSGFNNDGDETFALNGNNGDLVIGKNGTFRVTGSSGNLNIGNGKLTISGASGDIEMAGANINAGNITGAQITGGRVSMLGTGAAAGYDTHLTTDGFGMSAISFWTPSSETPATIRPHQQGAEAGPAGDDYDGGPDLVNGGCELVLRSPRNTGVTTDRMVIWMQSHEGNNGPFNQPRAVFRGDIFLTGPGVVYGSGNVIIDAGADSILDLGQKTNGVRSTVIRDRPYTGAANVYVTENGYLGQTSSAGRFKLDSRNMTLPDDLLEIPVKDWIDLTSSEERTGLLELGVRTEKQQELLDNGYGQKRIPGVVAEDVAAAKGGEAFVTKDAAGQLQGVSYERLAIAQIAVLNRQLKAERARNDDLEKRLELLEAKMRSK